MKRSFSGIKLLLLGCVISFAALSTGAMCDNDDDGWYYCSYSTCDYYAKEYNYTFDCDDHNPAINPGALEICDGVDDDCDGVMLDGETVDQDGDGLLACEDEDDDGIDALVDVKPEALKLRDGKFTAFVALPDPYDSSSIVECYADGAPAVTIEHAANKAICKFNVSDVTELPLDTFFEVWGVTEDGTSFWGADQINKIIE